MSARKFWEAGEFNENGGYDCMTAGVYAGNALLDGRMYGQESCEDMTPDMQAAMMADARLIAAAPDLQYVAAWLMQEYEQGDGSIPDGLYNAARTAIARSEGKS